MDFPTHAELVARIDDFLKRHSMAETRFGREATGEPALVTTLRAGRNPSLAMLQRLSSFMDDRDAEAAANADWPIGGTASAGNGGEISAAPGEAVAA